VEQLLTRPANQSANQEQAVDRHEPSLNVRWTSWLPRSIARSVSSATRSAVMPRRWSSLTLAFCSSMFLEKLVCVKPGLTSSTSMSSFASSARSASLKPCTANLLAEYSLRDGMPRRPAIDEMFKIAGVLPWRSIGRKTRVVSVVPKKLTSKIFLSRSGSASAKCPVAPMPALLTARPVRPVLGRLDRADPRW
jgi:hypothetical protein